MLALRPCFEKGKPLTILCLGAHSDDIEIGCGGTILKLIQDYENIKIYWIVFSSSLTRRKEAQESAAAFLQGAKRKNVIVKNFRDGFFPHNGQQIKNYFETLKRTLPDVIFTHYRADLHQDHRVISDLAWNTFRNHLILEYEIPKYDGDLGSPNCFVHLTKELTKRKIDYIVKYFVTQRRNQWFDRETFHSLLRLRGMESNAPTRYAEAFYCRKLLV